LYPCGLSLLAQFPRNVWLRHWVSELLQLWVLSALHGRLLCAPSYHYPLTGECSAECEQPRLDGDHPAAAAFVFYSWSEIRVVASGRLASDWPGFVASARAFRARTG